MIEIDEATISLNELLRKFRNVHKRAKERDRWHWLVMAKKPKAKIPEDKMPIGCCEVIVTRRAGGSLDWDNMGGGLKFLMDALVSTKIIVDDKRKVVRRLRLQQEVSRKLPPMTRIEIVPLLDG